MDRISNIFETDSYKVTHAPQYPPKSWFVDSYLEARGGPYDHTCVFGPQIMVKEYLSNPIIKDDIDEAQDFFQEHFFGDGTLFQREGWERVLNVHDGYLPIRLRSVPEGTNVPVKNALLTVRNTDKELPWMTNYTETVLSQLWYPMTVATLSQHCRRIILGHLRDSGTPEAIDFKLHDFGFRGVSSRESAMIGGMAHLVNFKGSDTLRALVGARRLYHSRMAGFSIPASEHSTITSWLRAHEREAMLNMLTTYKTGFVACVSDSFDIFHACESLWGDALRNEVLSRDGVLVIRPDSGDPVQVILKCLHILWSKFGGSVNQKGYRVLDPHVRLIQGDGVDPQAIDMILTVMGINGYSADNIAFGMGGALLQKLHRDTQKFAFKCSAIEGEYGYRDVFKDPITDPGKTSKAGRLTLYRTPGGKLVTGILGQPTNALGYPAPDYVDVMHTIYEVNGLTKTRHIYTEETLDAIRERAREGEEPKALAA